MMFCVDLTFPPKCLGAGKVSVFYGGISYLLQTGSALPSCASSAATASASGRVVANCFTRIAFTAALVVSGTVPIAVQPSQVRFASPAEATS